MKQKLIWLCAILSASYTLVAANPQKILDTKITEVTVYRNQASISNEATLTLNAGTTEVVLKQISSSIIPSSIQVDVKGDISILSARYEANYLQKIAMSPQQKNIQDSLDIIRDKYNWNTELISIYNAEENLLDANKSLGNDKVLVTALDVKNMADFYRIRITELREKRFGINRQQKELQEKITYLQQQLNEWNARNNNTGGQIVLLVSTNTTISGALRCNYLVNNAGWNASYDIRSEGWGKPLNLLFKANVYQNTGYNWNDVKLTLCTGNPSQNNDRPILNSLYVTFYDTRYRPVGATSGTYYAPAAMEKMNLKTLDGIDEESDRKYKVAAPVYNEQQSHITNETYELKLEQSILSDGKENIVRIKEYNLPASYEYHTVPKLDAAAYLLAKVSDYGKYNLLPGLAGIFLEGSYIGQVQIDPYSMGDTMYISLGKDNSISVSRIKLTEFCKSKWIDTRKTETFAYEISIKNNKSTAIEIDVLDQVPISKNEDIKVEIEDISAAVHNVETGKLNWKLNIAPGTIKKVRYIYTLKYPKDRQVIESN